MLKIKMKQSSSEKNLVVSLDKTFYITDNNKTAAVTKTEEKKVIIKK